MKGKRMNQRVSGDTHESRIVSAHLTGSARAALPANSQFRLPERPPCHCELGGDTPARSLWLPFPSPHGKLSPGSHSAALGHWDTGRCCSCLGTLTAPRGTRSLLTPHPGPPRALPPAPRAMSPGSSQTRHCTEKRESQLCLSVPFSVPWIQTLPSQTRLYQPRIQARLSDAGTHSLKLLLLALELLGKMENPPLPSSFLVSRDPHAPVPAYKTVPVPPPAPPHPLVTGTPRAGQSVTPRGSRGHRCGSCSQDTPSAPAGSPCCRR